MEELFVPIEGYPNYQVSNYGRVVNVKHDRDLTPTPGGREGYFKVRLYNEGVHQDYYVHSLVAAGFFLHFAECNGVSHLSSDLSDNSVGNLSLKFN